MNKFALSSLPEILLLLEKLPKVELHRHLIGSLRPATIIDLARTYHLALPTLDENELKQYIQIKPGDFQDLGAALRKMSAVNRLCFPSQAAIRRVTVEMVEDAWRDGLIYLEVRFSPAAMNSLNGLTFEQVIASVLDGLDEARKLYPVQTRVILAIVRDASPDTFEHILEIALDLAKDGRAAGIDIAGDEAKAPARQFVRLFERARADGRLGITVHAGEGAGAESVREAIELLGAQRIGHGVRARESPEVLKLAAVRGVTFETCPTSNVLTGAAPSFAEHPLRSFLAGGLRTTINTDDPAWFDVTLSHEYGVALTQLGLSFQDLKQAVLYAAAGAFLPQSEKDKLAKEISTRYDLAAPQFAKYALESER